MTSPNISDLGNSNLLPNQATFLTPTAAQLQQQPVLIAGTRRPPRLALLATLLFNPIILVGYYLFLYGPGNTCVAGPLICSFGDYAAILQVAIILAGCVVIWFLLFLLARWLVETPYGERNALVRGLRAITDTSKIRPLLLTYGLLLLLGLFIGLLKKQLNPPIVMLDLFTIFACLHSALDSNTEKGGTPD